MANQGAHDETSRTRSSVIVVTAGASAIGLALCKQLRNEAAQVVLSDPHEEATRDPAHAMDAFGLVANVGNATDVAHLVESTLHALRRIAMFCSNAGIGAVSRDAAVGFAQWVAITYAPQPLCAFSWRQPA